VHESHQLASGLESGLDLDFAITRFSTAQSCDACSLTAATAKALATAPCLDSDPECPGWADGGECEHNPVFMHRACPLSCKQCHKQDVSSV